MAAKASENFLPLMVWLSPAFPVGSFAYSHGIEWAVETGDIRDAATCETWVRDLLEHGGGWSDAVLLACTYRAVAAKDRDAILEVAELARAISPSRERRLETLKQGDAFLLAAKAAWPCEALEDFSKLWKDETAFPVALGIAAAGHNLPLVTALEAWLVAFASNLVSAAVRLVPLGQTHGTKIVASLVPLAHDVAARAVNASLDDIGGSAFRSDIASMKHETQYTRLFRS